MMKIYGGDSSGNTGVCDISIHQLQLIPLTPNLLQGLPIGLSLFPMYAFICQTRISRVISEMVYYINQYTAYEVQNLLKMNDSDRLHCQGCDGEGHIWLLLHLSKPIAPLRFFCVIFVQAVTAKMKGKIYTYNLSLKSQGTPRG